MIKSMTGFGRGEYSDGKRNYTVEIKSVNHRYADIQVRMSRRYMFAEDTIKNIVKDHISRGKVDVSLTVDCITESDIKVELNEPLALQYMEKLGALKDRFGAKGDVTLELVSQMPDVLKQTYDVEDEESVKAGISEACRKAAEGLEEMRAVEGEKLSKDLLARGELVRGLVGEVEEAAAKVPHLYQQKLKERLDDLLDGSTAVSEERLAQEVALFADKADVTEEVTRLKSHMEQMKEIIGQDGEPVGKKLDFLVQEMNREANTIGSKANDLGVTEIMLKIKAEVEKIREQVQNIE